MKRLEAELIEVVDVANELGEGVLWRESDHTIWWTDIQSCRLHRLDWPSLHHQVFETPERLCSFGFVESTDDWLIAAFDRGFALFAPASGEIRWLDCPAELDDGRRLNDGRVDPSGNFWAGSMIEGGDADRTQTGLYRLAANGTSRLVQTGLEISNGLNWSRDGSIMYYSDSPSQTIYRTRCSQDGTRLLDTAPFTQMDEGYPDGAAVDVDDCYWSAVWSAGKLVRYTPDGAPVTSIALPAPHLTCLSFGGDDMSFMFVTSAREGLSDSQLSAAPASGSLFILKAPEGSRGFPAFRFRESENAS